MKIKSKRILAVLMMCAGAMTVSAQPSDVEKLKQQLEQIQKDFDRVVSEQRRQIEALTRQVEQLQQAERVPGTGAVALAEAPTPTALASSGARESRPWSLTDPIRIGQGGMYMDIGLVGTFAAGGSTAHDIEGGTQLGGHDPNQRGFTVQGVEANFSGAVDPYFRGNANLLFAIDSQGESFVELEEAWLETMALPGNLQLRAGQYLTDFGRINTQHPHAWAFVDVPLVNGRFLGPDGLRNPGARLSWLAPTPFFTELSFGVQNSSGETASSFRSSGGHGHGDEDEDELPFAFRHADNNRGIRGLDDLLFSPRLATSFDLTDNQVLLLGASAALGPNSSGEEGDTRTQIYGMDLTWKWKSPQHHGGFPFVMWQNEAMLRRYKAGAFDWAEVAEEGGIPIIDDATGDPAVLRGETLTDYGFYTQLLYGFRKGWVAGLRFDYVTGERAAYERMALMLDDEPLGRDPLRNQRWRVSPNLTWYPSEFSKIRLQYNYDDRRAVGTDHSVWLQFEFVLGAHAAHKF